MAIITDKIEKLFWLSAIWEAIVEGRYELVGPSKDGGRIAVRGPNGGKIKVEISSDPYEWLVCIRSVGEVIVSGCFSCKKPSIFGRDRNLSGRVHSQWKGIVNFLQSIREARQNREELLEKSKICTSHDLGGIVVGVGKVDTRPLIAAEVDALTRF